MKDQEYDKDLLRAQLKADKHIDDRDEYDAFNRWYGEDFEDYCDELEKRSAKVREFREKTAKEENLPD